MEVFGDRAAVLARELTKVHEEFLRGTISELIKNLGEPRGEFVVLIEGNKFVAPQPEENLLDFYKKLLEQGLDKKTAMREAAKKFNVSRREIYNEIIRLED